MDAARDDRADPARRPEPRLPTQEDVHAAATASLSIPRREFIIVEVPCECVYPWRRFGNCGKTKERGELAEQEGERGVFLDLRAEMARLQAMVAKLRRTKRLKRRFRPHHCADGAQGDGAGACDGEARVAEPTAGATDDELLVPVPEVVKEGDQPCKADVQHTTGGQVFTGAEVETAAGERDRVMRKRATQDLLQTPATARGSGDPLGGSLGGDGGLADEERAERAYQLIVSTFGQGPCEAGVAENPFVHAVGGLPGGARSRRMFSIRRK